jgi:hypothetical protein
MLLATIPLQNDATSPDLLFHDRVWGASSSQFVKGLDRLKGRGDQLFWVKDLRNKEVSVLNYNSGPGVNHSAVLREKFSNRRVKRWPSPVFRLLLKCIDAISIPK